MFWKKETPTELFCDFIESQKKIYKDQLSGIDKMRADIENLKKDKVDYLKKIDSIKFAMNELNVELWKSNNPPKYKVGEPTNNGIVSNVEFLKGTDLNIKYEYENFEEYHKTGMLLWCVPETKSMWKYTAIKKGEEKPTVFY